MTDEDATRHALRKRAYDLKVAMQELAEELRDLHPEAAQSAHKGRLMAFEVWTYLATPIEDEDHD